MERKPQPPLRRTRLLGSRRASVRVTTLGRPPRTACERDVRPDADDCNRWTKRARVSRRLGRLLSSGAGARPTDTRALALGPKATAIARTRNRLSLRNVSTLPTLDHRRLAPRGDPRVAFCMERVASGRGRTSYRSVTSVRRPTANCSAPSTWHINAHAQHRTRPPPPTTPMRHRNRVLTLRRAQIRSDIRRPRRKSFDGVAPAVPRSARNRQQHALTCPSVDAIVYFGDPVQGQRIADRYREGSLACCRGEIRCGLAYRRVREVMGSSTGRYRRWRWSRRPAFADRERHGDGMNSADLVAVDSPPCHQCGESVQRAETRWDLDEDCNWRPGPYFMVCADGHRVLVTPLI
jgi:hypothetical protein